MSAVESDPSQQGETRAESAPWLRWVWQARGVIATAAILAAIIVFERFLHRSPRPVLLMLLVTSYAGHAGGIRAGLLSAALCVGATAFVLPPAAPHDEWIDPRVLMVGASAPFVGVIAGVSRRRGAAAAAAASALAAEQARNGERLRGARALEQAHDFLRDSEERFRQIADHVNAVLWMADPAIDRILYVSPAYDRVWGRPRQTLYDNPRSFIDAIHPDDLPGALAFFAREDRQGAIEYRVVRPDGDVRWIKDRVFPIRDESGRVHRMVGLAEDVTERKQAEEALRASEEFLRRMFDSSVDCIKTVDLDGRLLTMNQCGQHIMEIRDFGPLVGRRWLDFWPPGDRDKAAAAMAAALAGGVGTFEGFCPTAAGTPKWWHVTVTPVLDARGRPERLLSISRDVTPQHRAEEARAALAAEREQLLNRLQTTLNRLPIGCVLSDADFRFTYWNPAAERIFGYSSEEVRGKHPFDVITPPNRREQVGEIFRRLARGDMDAHATADDVRNLTRDGRLVACQWDNTPLHAPDGTFLGIISMCQDVTERRDAADRIDALNRDLRRRVAELEAAHASLEKAHASLADAHASLRASEARFAAFMRHLPGIAFMKDDRHRLVYVSEAFDKASFGPADLAIGKTTDELWPPDLARRLRAAERQVLETGRPVESVETVPQNDGDHHFLVTKFPIPGPDGRTALVGGIAMDVTGRTRAEESLRQAYADVAASEARFRRVFEAGVLGTLFWDVEGNVLDANDTFLSMLGYDRDDLAAGRIRWFNITPPEQRHVDERALGELRRSGSFTPFETEFLRKDGSRIPVYLGGAFLDASQSHGVSFVVDLTARKRAEDELRRNNHMLEAIINAAPVGVILYDQLARVRVWNPAAERIFGFPASDVIGRTPPTLADEQQRVAFAELTGRILSGESVHGLELSRRRRDGSTVEISLSAAPLRDASGTVTGIISVIADITESKRLREQLLQSQRIESVGRLAGGVAHDFNNLLNVISGYSESLARRLPAADPLRAHVREIDRAAERGASLTRQLLAFSRRQAIQPRPIDLNDVVAGVTPLLRGMLGDRIRFVARPADGPATVLADPSQTEQVLVNLALNARDAMPDGGTLTVATAHARLADDAPLKGLTPGRYVRLAVSDTGHGIDDETRNRIFEPFFTTKQGNGTGLGLSIVHGIVQQRGGSVCVESRPGRGTTFEVFLPAHDSPAPKNVAETELQECH